MSKKLHAFFTKQHARKLLLLLLILPRFYLAAGVVAVAAPVSTSAYMT